MQTVELNAWECRPSGSTIWGADRPKQDLECKPSHAMIWTAHGQIAPFRMQIVEFHSLECEAFKEHLFNWSEVQGIK